MEPGSADAWANLGGALAKAGRPDEAAKALREALALDPSHAAAHALLRELGRAR
jgi:predicted TPR repeat methyltransferase